MAESGQRARFMNGYTIASVEGSKLSRENPSPGVDDTEGGVRFDSTSSGEFNPFF